MNTAQTFQDVVKKVHLMERMVKQLLKAQLDSQLYWTSGELAKMFGTTTKNFRNKWARSPQTFPHPDVPGCNGRPHRWLNNTVKEYLVHREL